MRSSWSVTPTITDTTSLAVALRSLAEGKVYDLILIDLDLPGVDLTQMVEALHREAPTIPLLLANVGGKELAGSLMRAEAIDEVGVILQVLDVSPQQQARDEAQQLRAELEERVAQRTRALAAANETLRTEQRKLNFLKDVAEKANLTDDLEEVLAYCVRELCQISDWWFGQVLYVSPDGRVLAPSGIHYQGRQVPTDMEQLLTAPVMAGEQLPGKVWRLRRPLWEHCAVTAGPGDRCHLYGGEAIDWSMALPVLVGTRVIAVLEFFSTREGKPDENREAFVDQLYSLLRVVAERKEAEKELRKLALIAQQTDNAIVITDGAGYIEWVNPGYTRITGYTLVESIGKRPGNLLQGPETNPATVAALSLAVRRGEKYECEILNYDKRGQPYWLELALHPVLNAGGEVERFVAIERDISESKRMIADRKTPS